jgi:hypothetical protein
MTVVHTTVRVDDESVVQERAFVRRSGEPIAWLDVGALGELGVYGSAPAMRRVGAAVLAAADAVEALTAEPPDEAVGRREAA